MMRIKVYFQYLLAFFAGYTLVVFFKLGNTYGVFPVFMQNAVYSLMNPRSTILNYSIRITKTKMLYNLTRDNETTRLDASPGTEHNSTIVKTAKATPKPNNSTKKVQAKNSKQRPACRMDSRIPKGKIFDGKNPNVTVVTAYFNIGKFRKGSAGTFDMPLYKKWSHAFKNMQNLVIFYTDSEAFGNAFTKVRSKLSNTTKIIYVNKTDLWAFEWVDRIRSIYSIKGYPKHHPNTVVPEYSCTQHAKHAVVEDAILKNYSTTKYITWIDVGYFRYLAQNDKKFWIVKPLKFNDSRIAMNEVYSGKLKVKPEQVFKRNMVWIGGGMAFATSKVYLDFVQDYRQGVERFLNQSLMNTDQQVMYAMNLPEEKKVLKPKVDIQLYVPEKGTNCWFYLGYSCYREVP